MTSFLLSTETGRHRDRRLGTVLDDLVEALRELPPLVEKSCVLFAKSFPRSEVFDSKVSLVILREVAVNRLKHVVHHEKVITDLTQGIRELGRLPTHASGSMIVHST